MPVSADFNRLISLCSQLGVDHLMPVSAGFNHLISLCSQLGVDASVCWF